LPCPVVHSLPVGRRARMPVFRAEVPRTGPPAHQRPRASHKLFKGVVPTRRTSRPTRPRIRCLACGQPASSPDAKTLTRSPRGNARLPTLPSARSSTWPWKPLSENSSKTPISPNPGRSARICRATATHMRSSFRNVGHPARFGAAQHLAPDHGASRLTVGAGGSPVRLGQRSTDRGSRKLPLLWHAGQTVTNAWGVPPVAATGAQKRRRPPASPRGGRATPPNPCRSSTACRRSRSPLPTRTAMPSSCEPREAKPAQIQAHRVPPVRRHPGLVLLAGMTYPVARPSNCRSGMPRTRQRPRDLPQRPGSAVSIGSMRLHREL
jgi:hypothetical protein